MLTELTQIVADFKAGRNDRAAEGANTIAQGLVKFLEQLDRKSLITFVVDEQVKTQVRYLSKQVGVKQ